MKDTIKDIIKEFQFRKLPAVYERNTDLPLNTDSIITVIGARRCGKTYLLYQTINKLLQNKTDKQKILFLNFEDERLNLSAEQLDLIIQAYIELFPDFDLSECYFFFDEIQNITGWEKFVRRIFDTITRNIFITGSNSKLLGSEIAPALHSVALEYIKCDYKLLYFNDYYECNFIVCKNNEYIPVQVSYNIDDSHTLQREIRGLIKASEKLNVKQARLITFDTEKSISESGIDIQVTPMYKHFLQNCLNG